MVTYLYVPSVHPGLYCIDMVQFVHLSTKLESHNQKAILNKKVFTTWKKTMTEGQKQLPVATASQVLS